MSKKISGARRWIAAPLAITLLIVALANFSSTSTTEREAAKTAAEAVAEPTKAQVAEWEAMTYDASARGEVVRKLQRAFAGVANVTTDGPHFEAAAEKQTKNVTFETEPILAFGVNGGKFWITASYADITNVGLASATVACVASGIPNWICAMAATTLGIWANGWAPMSNHGVWAEVSWRWPFVRGGRW